MTATTERATATTKRMTERRFSYEQCREAFGTDDVQELNRRLADAAQVATDGNCSQWAIYANGGILVVTEY